MKICLKWLISSYWLREILLKVYLKSFRKTDNNPIKKAKSKKIIQKKWDIKDEECQICANIADTSWTYIYFNYFLGFFFPNQRIL